VAASALRSRLTDVTDDGVLNPISGVMKAELLSLEQAAEATGIEDIEMHAFMAMKRAQALEKSGELGDLSLDEAGALTLYTMESELYPTLNGLLRKRDRIALKPYFPYLRLLMQASEKLPAFNGVAWRGVAHVDLRGDFPKGKELWWWAFSSTTKEVETLQNESFLGQSGTRTQFMIEVTGGVDIEKFSIYQGATGEAEVLLFPGANLKVVSTAQLGNGLTQVHLKMLKTPKLMR